MRNGDGPWVLVLLAGMGAIIAPGLYRPSGQANIPRVLAAKSTVHKDRGVKDRGVAHAPGLRSEKESDPATAKVLDLLQELMGRERLDDDTLAQVIAEYRKNGANVSTLVMTVPDPAQTNFDAYYDQAMESIQRAVASADFVPDRFDLPWKQADAKDANFDVELPSPAGDDRTVRVRSHSEESAEKIPGILLFRKWNPKTNFPDVLIVLVVGETATGGLHQEAFRSALGIADELGSRDTDIYILGPFFSGTSQSLRRALDEHPRWHRAGHPKISVLSGTANGPDNYATIAGGNVTFATTTVPVLALRSVLLRAIEEHANGSREKAMSVALLVETGTGWGAEVSKRAGSEGQEPFDPNAGRPADSTYGWVPQTFHFPLHIAQLRAERERSKETGSSDARVPSLDTTLQLHLDQDPESRDELPAHSSITAYTVELTLREQLAAISREHYRFLGIEATDPTDTVFIAQEARKYCPGVQLFALGSEQLFTHPDLMRDLNGLIIATTYPLSGEVDGWTNPQEGRREAFASDVAEGVYNAGLALLGQMKLEKAPIPFRDYSNPDTNVAGGQVWLTMISNGASWPLHMEPAAKVKTAAGREAATNADPAATKEEAADVHMVQGAVAIDWKIRHSVGAIAWGMYWLAICLAFAHLYWFAKLQRRRRHGIQIDHVLRLDQARSAGVMLVSVFLTCLYWTAILFSLSRHPSNGWERLAWRVGEFFGSGACIALTVVAALSVQPAFKWVTSTQGWELGARRSARLRSIIVSALGAVVAVFSVRFIWETSFPPEALKGDLLLTLSRTIQPMSGVSPALPLLYIAIGTYLWGYFDYRRAGQQARFPDSVPFPHDEGIAYAGLREAAESVAFGVTSAPFRIQEMLAVGLAVFPGGYFWFRLTPTFEVPAFDNVFRAAVFFLIAAVLSAVGRTLAHWSDLRKLLRRLARQPMVDAFDRVGPAPPRLFGLDLGVRVHPAHELEDAIRIANLLANDEAPLAGGPSLRDRVRTEATLTRRAFEDEVRGRPSEARIGTQAALFRLSRLLLGALEQLWSSMPLPGGKVSVESRGQADAATYRTVALETYRQQATPDVQRWIQAAEDIVARQIVAVIDLALARLRSLMTFAITAALMLVFAAMSYPFYPVRFVQLFAWSFALAVIVPTCIVIGGIERDHVLSRIAHTQPGRLNFNPAFIGQVVVYGVLPIGALIATIFPEVGAVLFSWLQPLMRVLH